MRFRSPLRRAGMLAGCLSATALLLDTAAAAPKVKPGALVEIQDQENRVVRFELREVLPAHHGATLMRFAKKPGASLEEMAMYQVPINARDTGNLREIRISPDPAVRLALTGVDGDVNLQPVIIVPRQGFTSEWYWVGERLAGVERGKGIRPRPYSIALSDVKVVRFVVEPQGK